MILFRKNKDIYDGFWVNDKQEGEFFIHYKNKGWLRTIWKEGVLIENLGPANIKNNNVRNETESP